jgi:hypothetical protein
MPRIGDSLSLFQRSLEDSLAPLKQTITTLESHIIYLANKYADLVKFNNILAKRIAGTQSTSGVYVIMKPDENNRSVVSFKRTLSEFADRPDGSKRTSFADDGTEALRPEGSKFFISVSEILLDDAVKIIKDCLVNLPPQIVYIKRTEPRGQDDEYYIKNSDIFVLEKIIGLLF